MRYLSHKKLMAILLSLSLLISIFPSNIVLAVEEAESEISYGEINTPVPVVSELLQDTEQVIVPAATPYVSVQSDENLQINEIQQDESQINQDFVKENVLIDIGATMSPITTEKPYEIVDMLPSKLETLNNQRTSSTSYNERDLYSIKTLKQNEYNPKESQQLSINSENGNVGYTYNIASVPGKNGSVMSLDIEYNSTESIFAKSTADITDARDYYLDPYIEYDAEDSLGAGWKFSNLKRRILDRYYTLYDGRVVNKYNNNDDYDYYSISGDTISYIDGTIEQINEDGYIAYTEDKYGNRITYTYEDYVNPRGTDAIRLKSITDNLNRSIIVDYYSNYVEITKPDNNKVRLTTNDIAVEHIAADRGYDWTMTAKVINGIYDVTEDKYIANFEYQSMYFRYLFAPAGVGIMTDDYGAFMPMTSYSTTYNASHYIDYEVVADNSAFPLVPSVNKKKWYLCAVKDYTTSAKTNWSSSYTYDIDDVDERIGIEVTANNKVIKTIIGYMEYRQEVYERQNDIDILKESMENQYSKIDHRTRPMYTISKKYNSNGNYITSRTDYTYNAYGNVLTSTEKVDDNVHIESSYTYYTNSYKSLKDVTVKKGTQIFNKVTYEVNSLGDVTSERIYDGNNNLQRNTGFTYSNNNLVCKTIYSGATINVLQREKYTYTGAYMTRAYTTTPSDSVIADVSYTYDNNTGRVTAITDVNGTESVQYDSLGRITRETHADGTYKTITYNYIDAAVDIKNEDNYICHYWYNNQGKIERFSEQTASGDDHTLQTITYDTVGNPITTSDALNNTTNITYDSFGRQTSVKYPGNTTTAKAKYYDVFLEGDTKYSVYLTISETGRIACEYYDIYGRLEKTALIKNYSSFSESNFNNIYQMPSNAELVITSRYVYDDLDRVIEQYDGENRPTYYTYDSVDNIINMKQGNSGDSDNPQINISYEYNSAGNLTKVTQGAHVSAYVYDYAGRLTQMTDPMGYTETYTYDTAGNVKTAKDKNGITTTNTYNNRGLLSRTSKSSEYIEYTYDGVGNVLTTKDKNGTISYTYNYDSTLASKTYPDNKTITYSAYNSNKALTSMIDYLGNTTTYTYNARGAVTAIGEKYLGTSTTKTTRYTYNSDGSLQKVTYPLSNYMTSVYTYDYAGRVSNLTNKLTSSSTYSTHAYTYDNSGNITQKVDTISGTSKTTSYIYDSVNRLIRETIGSSTNRYYYDQYSNIRSEIGWGDTYYTYDANNRLKYIDDQWCYKETADGSLLANWESDLTYDKNGNLLTYNTCSYDGVYEDSSHNTYTYDAWGRLTNFSDSLGETASYSYYSDGLRASKTIGSNTTKYYYDGDNVINETLNGNSYATNVVGVDGYISRKQNSTTGYLFKNAHGDVLAAYSSTSNKLADYSYTAWGEQRSVNETSSFTNNPLRYCGEYYDYESGMTYLRARYYDSNIKRFISEDPIKDGLNWYSYAGNNPVMYVDPSGLWGELVHVEATKWIFTEMGLNSYHANVVAEANISVDKGEMAATNYNNMAQSRHFDRNPNSNIDSREVWAEECLNAAVSSWNAADEMYYNQEITFEQRHEYRVEALKSLGRGLHSLQDIDAHMDMKTDDFSTPIATPHLFKGDAPWQYSDVDNPRYDAKPTGNVGEYQKVDTGSDFGSERYSNTVARTKSYLNRFYSQINVAE